MATRPTRTQVLPVFDPPEEIPLDNGWWEEELDWRTEEEEEKEEEEEVQ